MTQQQCWRSHYSHYLPPSKPLRIFPAPQVFHRGGGVNLEQMGKQVNRLLCSAGARKAQRTNAALTVPEGCAKESCAGVGSGLNVRSRPCYGGNRGLPGAMGMMTWSGTIVMFQSQNGHRIVKSGSGFRTLRRSGSSGELYTRTGYLS